jgi:hypothetical protein
MLHEGKKSAIKQWLLWEESIHKGRHVYVTRAIIDEVGSKRADRLFHEWTRSNRSRNLTRYITHTCQIVAEFNLAANWTNEGSSVDGSQSPDLMITATWRETRSMTAHTREVE